MSIKLDDVLRVVDRWEKASFLHLAAGEMTAQETRTAIAVVRAIKAELKELFDGAQ